MTDNNAVKPAHYKKAGGIETIDYLEAVCADIPGDEAVAVGNAIKYLSRYRQKNPTNPLRDVEKSLWYVQRLVQILKDKEEKAKRGEFMEYLVDEADKLVNEELIYGVRGWLAESIEDSTKRVDAMVPSPYEKNRKEDIEANAIVFPSVFPDPRQQHPALRDLGQYWKD
jgi:hypothetical protein